MEVVSPPCPARALRLALLGLGLWVGAQKMVLQRFGGGRDLVSPRLRSLDSVPCSLRRRTGDFALSPRGVEALDLGRGEATRVLKKCTTAFSLGRRRAEDCWGEAAWPLNDPLLRFFFSPPNILLI